MPDSVTELFTQGSRFNFSQHPEITLKGQGGQRSGKLGHSTCSLQVLTVCSAQNCMIY